jgi:hypothetical protein
VVVWLCLWKSISSFGSGDSFSKQPFALQLPYILLSIRKCKNGSHHNFVKIPIGDPAENPRTIQSETGQKLVFIPYKKSLRMVIVPTIEEAYGMLPGLETENLREEEDEHQR